MTCKNGKRAELHPQPQKPAVIDTWFTGSPLSPPTTLALIAFAAFAVVGMVGHAVI